MNRRRIGRALNRTPLAGAVTTYKYIRLLGLRDALRLRVNELLHREVLLPLRLRDLTIYVRANTSDISVVSHIFYRGELDKATVDNPAVIVDAGAYIGASSVFFATKFPKASIFAIEPERGNYDLLVRNTGAFDNIIPIHAALWSESCTRTLQDRGKGHWGYTISDTSNPRTSTNETVACITIDGLLSEYGLDVIDILKIDIEGSEKCVFESSSEWIGRVRLIAIELHERICEGCVDAFEKATVGFARVERSGEKVIAFRDPEL